MRYLSALLMFCLMASLTNAETLDVKDKKYTIDYPEGWVVAGKEQKKNLENAVDDASKGAVKAPSKNMSMIYLEKDAGKTNINVIAQKGAIVVTPEFADQVQKVMTTNLVAAGMKISKPTSGVETFADRKCLALRHEMEMNNVTFKQFIVMIPGKEGFLIFTSPATAEEFAKHEETFTKMVNSIKFEPTDAK